MSRSGVTLEGAASILRPPMLALGPSHRTEPCSGEPPKALHVVGCADCRLPVSCAFILKRSGRMRTSGAFSLCDRSTLFDDRLGAKPEAATFKHELPLRARKRP